MLGAKCLNDARGEMAAIMAVLVFAVFCIWWLIIGELQKTEGQLLSDEVSYPAWAHTVVQVHRVTRGLLYTCCLLVTLLPYTRVLRVSHVFYTMVVMEIPLATTIRQRVCFSV
jgi:hypothetical protein